MFLRYHVLRTVHQKPKKTIPKNQQPKIPPLNPLIHQPPPIKNLPLPIPKTIKLPNRIYLFQPPYISTKVRVRNSHKRPKNGKYKTPISIGKKKRIRNTGAGNSGLVTVFVSFHLKPPFDPHCYLYSSMMKFLIATLTILNINALPQSDSEVDIASNPADTLPNTLPKTLPNTLPNTPLNLPCSDPLNPKPNPPTLFPRQSGHCPATSSTKIQTISREIIRKG